MNPSKTKKPIKGRPMKHSRFKKIMNEYQISPNEYQRNLNIVHAVSMNDEVYLRKILQYEV